MYSKFTRLSFVIGLFFFLTALILFGNAVASGKYDRISIVSALVFLVFGVVMMTVTNNRKSAADD